MCGKCHTCGHEIRIVLDGEEWCDKCQRYQRPISHGWAESNYSTAVERLSCAEAREAMRGIEHNKQLLTRN